MGHPMRIVDFPADELDRIAARMMLDRLDGGRTSPEQLLLPHRLIVRDSATVPPTRHGAQPAIIPTGVVR